MCCGINEVTDWANNIKNVSDQILPVLSRVWGYDSLRPMQLHAIEAVLGGNDALVVMPTGGGKSLCFQLPPLVTGRLTVVVSPLIALMKDQVDGLRMLGYDQAVCLHSGQTSDDNNSILRGLSAGNTRLLYISPEKLLSPGVLAKLVSCDNSQGPYSFAIDEAHCISQWGHDFRPEYRRLKELRATFPQAAFHAFTATATPRVRADIAQQLGLRNYTELVGSFDRPNLTYRVVPKTDLTRQCEEVLRRHTNGATIIYATTRKAVESVASDLRSCGFDASVYHAGLDQRDRQRVQEQFSSEQVNIIVATIAFGMGINRSNVRCVIHADLPKSIENYQQETGRAGRDGLPSECIFFYSSGDASRLKQVLASGDNGEVSPQMLRKQYEFIDEVQRFATSSHCRHRFLCEYFGQQFTSEHNSTNGCGACDVCLGELDTLADSLTVAKKILACVARLQQHSPNQNFGAQHIADVLRGSRRKQISDRGHDALSTYGILSQVPLVQVVSCIHQMVDLGLLQRSTGQFPMIGLTTKGLEVMRGTNPELVTFRVPRASEPQVSQPLAYDERCFEVLRRLRTQLATQRNIAAYLIFSDQVLQDLSRYYPTTPEHMAQIKGVVQRKLIELGRVFCEQVAAYCQQHSIQPNLPVHRERGPALSSSSNAVSGRKARAIEVLSNGGNLADAAIAAGVTSGTVAGYLAEHIRLAKLDSIDAWVDVDAQQRILAAAESVSAGSGSIGMRPIFDALDGEFSYDHIKIVLAHRQVLTGGC